MMGMFPRTGTVAVPRRQKKAKGARQRRKRPVVMKADGRLLVLREFVAKFRKDVDATTTVTFSVSPSRLAHVVKECHDCNAVGIEPALVGEHIVVHFDRVCSKSALFLVMAIAPTLEIG